MGQQPDDTSEQPPECFEDRKIAGQWRVEYGDADGGCYVTIFAGPMARERASLYHRALLNRVLLTVRAA